MSEIKILEKRFKKKIKETKDTAKNTTKIVEIFKLKFLLKDKNPDFITLLKDANIFYFYYFII